MLVKLRVALAAKPPVLYVVVVLLLPCLTLGAGAIVPIPPLKPVDSITAEKIRLGRSLFEERLLSRDNSVSCSSCHDLSGAGVDHKPRSIGINGAVGDINAPTVFNATFNFRQFWNGRAKTLEAQIDGPVQNPKEMGSSWNEVVRKLKAIQTYQDRFRKIYPDGVTPENVKDAIATFERQLVTPDSRFDEFLSGKSALDELAKKGYENFKSFGCISCHQGVNVGGNMYQTMGVMGNYFKDRGTPITEADLGRFAVTKREADKYVFRVPSLRNVELTAPYFHDGSASTLEDAVRVMAKYQLGRQISDREIDSVVAFLKTLTGKAPAVLENSRTTAGAKAQ
ncbi:MAG: cytochrome B6 [Bdellovibrio sp.]|nr:MAG: cytochrome B6 [Bdellovibrio sp.]